MSIIPSRESPISDGSAGTIRQPDTVAQSMLNASVPYVDKHYGSADGIIDPTEYSYNYTDPVTGITVYLEHNSTILYVGLSGHTSGWIAFGWKNSTSDFATDGINGSDLVIGYAPGTPHLDYPRVTGSEPVTVHYQLTMRNGTVIQEGNLPADTSTRPVRDESLLQGYKNQIYGMRIGEKRHFVIPAAQGYTEESNQMYGEDLEFVIQLTRIGSSFINPAQASKAVYSYQRGISTFQHLPYANQSRILAANASDNGVTTQLEYFIRMNSTSSSGIPLFNETSVRYPLVLMFAATEDFTALPVQHSDWSYPLGVQLVPNAAPTLLLQSPRANESLAWVTNIGLNATDNTFVRRAFYKIDDGNWTKLHYNFLTSLWESMVDLSKYTNGTHSFRFNATDPSNLTSVVLVNLTINRPYISLLGMRLSVSRTLSDLLFHATQVVDVFTIVNNGSAPISAFELYLPAPYASNFLSLSAEDGSKKTLSAIQLNDVSGMIHWRIYLFEPVGFQESYTVKTTMNLQSVDTLKDFNANSYEISFLKYPVVPYVLTYASLSLGLRGGDTPLGPSPEGRANNLPPMKIESFTFLMQSYSPLIIASRVTDVTVDPWGWLSYQETVSLENAGPAKADSLVFTIPVYSSNIKIYDEVGLLTKSQMSITDASWNGTIDLKVNLKADRFGDSFWPGNHYTFYLEYRILASAHQQPTSNGGILTIPMGTMGDLRITKHIIDVILPFSVDALEVSKNYRLLYGIFDTTLRYTVYNTTAQNSPTISLRYLASVWVTARPLVFSLIIAFVAVAYIAYRKLRLPTASTTEAGPEVTPSGTKQSIAPPELLRKFATTYSKKTSLELDLEKLEDGLKRGKVKKREFMIREGDIKSQTDDVDKDLAALKNDVVSYGPKYRDMVAQLDLHEERIAGAKAGLNQLMIRRRKQKISAGAFERTRQDYLKAIKKAVAATDRILLSIQEEAGEL